MENIINFTDRAVVKIKEVITEENDPSLMLRVFVQGGGCSGFQYGFSLENSPAEDDSISERDGVRVVVDPMSYQYLVGANIDYVDDLSGARFVLENPNAKSSCGCGSSFST